jgi:hypothetical protein
VASSIALVSRTPMARKRSTHWVYFAGNRFRQATPPCRPRIGAERRGRVDRW